MNLRPYPAYRDSGVDWLRQLPTHWRVVPPFALFWDSKERAHEGDQMLSATQKYGVIPLADFEALEQRQVTKATANFEMRKHVEVGDFVISMRSMDGGLERSHAVGSVRSSYSVLKAGPLVDGDYFGALMKCSLYIQALRLTSNFIRDGQDLSFSHVRRVKLPLPDLEEQRLIAAHLDGETARIDALVAKKTRFIELLRDKRQALITHAVTKGLDPSAQMKDTGVEWLGEVPAHWEVVPPGILFTDSKERAHEGDQMLSATQKYGVIPLAEFEELEQRRVTKASTNFEIRKHVEVGDFVISMRSMDGGLERTHATGSVRSSYSVLKAHSEVHGAYFGLLMKCDLFIQALRLTSNFIREGQDLSFTHVKKVKLPLPHLAEQQMIAEYVARATVRIDALVAKTERSIELLREHRTALITAAVTGKIDLRDAS